MENEESKLMVDCSKLPSDNNCQVMVIAPEGQREDLIDIAVAHAVKAHGHNDSAELREATSKLVEPV